MDLKLLVNDSLNLLHRLEDQEPRLYVEDMAQTVGNIEESLADEHIPLRDGH